MQLWRFTAGLAAILASATVTAEPVEHTGTGDVDELVVVGRSVATSLARIQVDEEMLVDTATVLKNIPGADVNTNGPVTGIAQYRGMHGDRVAVVIDHLGIVSGGPNAMDTPLSYVSPMITGELSVSRGIASVSLAPESIGGHISAALSRGDFATTGTQLSGFVGSRYTANGDVTTSAGRLTLATPGHKVSLLAELDDGKDVSTPEGKIRPSLLHRKRADLSYAYSTDRASILLFAGRLDTDDSGTPALPMDMRFIHTNMAGATASFDVSDTIRLESRIAWNDVEHLMDNYGLRQEPAPMAFRQTLASGGGTQLSLATSIGFRDSSLKLGIDRMTADHDATISNPNNALFHVVNFAGVTRDVSSIFAEWQRDSGHSELELGLRARRVRADADDVSASGMMGPMGFNAAVLASAFNGADRRHTWDSLDAVAKYRLHTGNDSEWSVEVGSKARAPSYQESYLWLPLQATGGLADGRSYIGGPDLDVERSNEIVLGFSRHLGTVLISPQVFYRRVDGYIQGVPSDSMTANQVSQMMSGAPALEFANVDAEIWGADLAWKVTLSDSWYADGTTSYSRGKRRDVHDNLYRLAPPNATAGVTWESEALAVTTELSAYAKQNKVAAYNDEQRTSGYATVNTTMIWHPMDSLRLEVRIDNVFDRGYQDHVAGINRAAGSDISVGDRLYGTGRAISVGAILNF